MTRVPRTPPLLPSRSDGGEGSGVGAARGAIAMPNSPPPTPTLPPLTPFAGGGSAPSTPMRHRLTRAGRSNELSFHAITLTNPRETPVPYHFNPPSRVIVV